MIKILFVFLVCVCSWDVAMASGGNIGTHDDRRPGSLEHPDYRGVVKLDLDYTRCTGVFIDKDLILTNNHCADDCYANCTGEFWDGTKYVTARLKPLFTHKTYKTLDGNDWSILSSDIPNSFYRTITPQTVIGEVIRGGYGTLRIIKDEEIPKLRQIYADVTREYDAKCTQADSYVDCINEYFNQRLIANNIKPVFGDINNFKVQKCKILGDYPNHNKMVRTTCDSAGGDSGAPYLRAGNIVALNNSGPANIFNDDNIGANGVKTENFYESAKAIITQNRANNANNYSRPPKPVTSTDPNDQTPPVAFVDSDGDQVVDGEANYNEMLQNRFSRFDCD